MDHGAELYAQYLSGNDEALAMLIQTYQEGLTYYLNRFAGNIDVADELTEDVFVRLVTKRPHYNGKASFKTWLYTIGRHIAIDHLRRRAVTRTVPIGDSDAFEAQNDPESAYIRQEELRTVYAAMKRLKPAHQQVLWLIYFEGFTQKEVATIMGKRVHAVEMTVHRAKQALRTELQKEGLFDERL